MIKYQKIIKAAAALSFHNISKSAHILLLPFQHYHAYALTYGIFPYHQPNWEQDGWKTVVSGREQTDIKLHTESVLSVCRRCQKIHHDGWWVWVITSKCSLPCAVMHGGLVGSQSVLAAVCFNNSLWWGILQLMRHVALLCFVLLLRLIIWQSVWVRWCYLLLSC